MRDGILYCLKYILPQMKKVTQNKKKMKKKVIGEDKQKIIDIDSELKVKLKWRGPSRWRNEKK